jgi:hypothetical protein
MLVQLRKCVHTVFTCYDKTFRRAKRAATLALVLMDQRENRWEGMHLYEEPHDRVLPWFVLGHD